MSFNPKDQIYMVIVKRRGQQIEIKPESVQRGDKICDAFGIPLRDKKGRDK